MTTRVTWRASESDPDDTRVRLRKVPVTLTLASTGALDDISYTSRSSGALHHASTWTSAAPSRNDSPARALARSRLRFTCFRSPASDEYRMQAVPNGSYICSSFSRCVASWMIRVAAT